MKKAKETLEIIISSLVKNVDKVQIEQLSDEMGILLSVKLDKLDMGKIIGKKGETVKAIRTIIRAIGMTEKARVNVKIEEPDNE